MYMIFFYMVMAFVSKRAGERGEVEESTRDTGEREGRYGEHIPLLACLTLPDPYQASVHPLTL